MVFTVTCKRCGKRHEFESMFEDEDFIISVKQQMPLCRACKRKLGLNPDELEW